MVTPPVTIPSSTQVSSVARVNRTRHGRPTIRSTAPAQASRSHATPSGPIWPDSPTEAAIPSWTQDMEPRAISVPVLAPPRVPPLAGVLLLMTAVNTGSFVHVHMLLIDIPFMNHE